MDVDAYLMAVRRCIARRGTPAELWSDQGTDFKGEEWELKKWEREIRSVKSAFYTCVGAQPVHEEVLLTVLLEVEAINSKPLSCVSSDIADIDPVTPSSLLMGRPDGSLP